MTEHTKTTRPSELELAVGRTYRAKKPTRIGAEFNDRTIVWIADGNQRKVQYDGPAVKIGSRLPVVSAFAFLQWAGSEVSK